MSFCMPGELLSKKTCIHCSAFSASLQDLIPNLHLVVAGEMANVPFTGMGVYSVEPDGNDDEAYQRSSI